MHKTHIFDQKENAKKIYFYRPTYPIFLQTVTGNKQFLFLGLISVDEDHLSHKLPLVTIPVCYIEQ